MNNLFMKLKSRKFLSCVAGIVTGLCLIFGADMNIVTTVSGAVVSLGSVIAYIIVEGRIDNTAVLNDASSKLSAVIKLLKEEERLELEAKAKEEEEKE